jgi:peptidoglycan DL-endopeptidase CwlO
VASQRLKRGMRGALTASAIIAVVSTTSQVPALAQPPANSDSDAVKKYKDLTDQADKINEDLLKATDDLNAKQGDLDKANQDLAAATQAKSQALATQDQFRGQVDELSTATFQGARFNKLSALLTGTSAQDFLDRSTALNVLATDNNKALTEMSGAVKTAQDSEAKAADATKRATDARDAAAKLKADIQAQKNALDAQINQVKSAAQKLSKADKQALAGPPDNGVFITAPGAAGAAVQAALSRRGDPYVWGGDHPGGFDCSGLIEWAYGQAGVSLPRSSREQYAMGKSVSVGDLQPGDLLFYGGSAGSIHHVAMYVGGDMLVHASTAGQPVKTAHAPDGGGSDFFAAKRIVG